MPTYEYRCRDCGHQFEIVQAFTDDSLTECPECGGSLGKVFGTIGIAFKGDGFYKTDSRGPAPTASTDAGGDGGSSGDGTGSSTSTAGSGSTSDSGGSAGSGD